MGTNTSLARIVPDTTNRLGVGRTTVYRLIEEGQLETVQVGRRRLVLSESIDAFIERLRAQQAGDAA